MFYSCCYIIVAVGPSIAGYLQHGWRSPSAGLIAGAAVLMPLALSFAALSISIVSPKRTVI
ncbi:hypothetical protein [Bradyrhizobium sp.]|uniref:hypothetical protein n=1 Tax=Bradyrhizobium sp. TaxID=376 RepID=UPI003C27AD46